MESYPKWNAGDEKQTDGFLEWLRDQGTSISHKIALTDRTALGRGRGVIALVDIEENEELFSVPQSAVLSTANSELRSKVPDIDQLDPWLSLILVMIYEYNLGRSGRWYPYFSVLPSHFDTLIHWSADELKELQGSAVLSKIGKEDADKTFKEVLMPLAKKCDGNIAEGSDEWFMFSAHRMATLIMAYGFDLERDRNSQDADEEGFVSDDEGEQPKGMVPLADMLNADGEKNNARLYHGATSLTMIVTKRIEKGEEIFNDYGPLPRSDLLRRYGYVSDEYQQWDVVEIDSQRLKEAVMNSESKNGSGLNYPTGLTENELNERIKLAEGWEVWEETFDISREAGDPVRPSAGLDPALLQSLHILAATAKEFNLLKHSKKPPKPALNSASAKLLTEVLKARRDDYHTTCAQDEALLQGLTADKQSNVAVQRISMATNVRLGEKHIIEAVLLYLHENHTALPFTPGATLNGGTKQDGTHYSAKRRRSDSISDSHKLVQRR